MFLLLLASFTLSALLCVAVIKHSAAIDVPNERSSHTKPVPRGGGIAFIVAFFSGIVILFGANLMPYYVLVALAGGGGIIGLVGYLDDLNPVSPLLKAMGQAASLVWGLFWLGPVPYIEVSDFIWQWGIIGIALSMICGLWMINLFNFMDGIDGIAATQTIFICISAAIFCLSEGFYGQAWALGILASAVGGFLIFNWQPAKLFMGDSGSGFLGLMIALFAIATTPPLSLWPWAVLVTLFVADSTVTVARRIMRGEKWYAGHKLHAYQRLAQRWNSHRAATISFMAANIVFVFPLALWAWSEPAKGVWAWAIAWGTAFPLAYVLGAGRKSETG